MVKHKQTKFGGSDGSLVELRTSNVGMVDYLSLLSDVVGAGLKNLVLPGTAPKDSFCLDDHHDSGDLQSLHFHDP